MLKGLGQLPWMLFVFGAFVWGIISIDGFNLIEYFFRHDWVVRAVYIIFGLSFVIEAAKRFKHWKIFR